MEKDPSGRVPQTIIDTGSDPNTLYIKIPEYNQDGTVNKLDVFEFCSDPKIMPLTDMYQSCVSRMVDAPGIEVNPLDGVGKTIGDFANEFPVGGCYAYQNSPECVVFNDILTGEEVMRVPTPAFIKGVEDHTTTQEIKPLGIEFTAGWVLATALVLIPIIGFHRLSHRVSNRVNKWLSDRKYNSAQMQHARALKQQRAQLDRQIEDLEN